MLADCALTPLTAVGTSLVIESAVDRPATVAIAKRGDVSQLSSPLPPLSPSSPARTLRLPIAGHAVSVSLDSGAVYEVSTTSPGAAATAAAEPETSWVISAPGAYVTDAEGHVLAVDLPAGARTVTAWLPPRAGQPARFARGTVTITAGARADLTLSLK